MADRSITLYRGSAIANAASQFAMAGTLLVYIWGRGLHKATWPGECAHMLRTSLSSLINVMGVKPHTYTVFILLYYNLKVDNIQMLCSATPKKNNVIN